MTVSPTQPDTVARAEIAIDAATSLTADLIESVLAAALHAEDSAAEGQRTVVVLRVTGSVGTRTPWPGPVAVGEVGKWENALRRLERAPAPVIAVVQGDAYGAAAEVMLAADHRIIADSAVVELATSADGAWPSMALHRLVTHVGVAGARAVVLRSRPIPAAEAVQLGVVDAAVPVDEQPAALDAAETLLCHTAGTEFAIRRRLLFDAVTSGFEESLGAHLAAADRTLRRNRGRDA